MKEKCIKRVTEIEEKIAEAGERETRQSDKERKLKKERRLSKGGGKERDLGYSV